MNLNHIIGREKSYHNPYSCLLKHQLRFSLFFLYCNLVFLLIPYQWMVGLFPVFYHEYLKNKHFYLSPFWWRPFDVLQQIIRAVLSLAGVGWFLVHHGVPFCIHPPICYIESYTHTLCMHKNRWSRTDNSLRGIITCVQEHGTSVARQSRGPGAEPSDIHHSTGTTDASLDASGLWIWLKSDGQYARVSAMCQVL